MKPFRSRILVCLLLACLLASACSSPSPTAAPTEEADVGEPSPTLEEQQHAPEAQEPAPEASPTAAPGSPVRASTSLLHETDLVYQGAFRLPADPAEFGWDYSGYAMTFYPDGDPGGPADGFPGSLFILGHDQQQLVAEVSIPAPLVSETKNPAELPTAAYLQDFHDITGGMFPYLEIPRAGLAYLPAQGDQVSGKLYFCWGQHFQFEPAPSHGWSELDLSNPQPAGPWFIADLSNYVTNDYLFEIPQAWADAYAPGMRLATGRFRDGTWGGLGPALIAIAPWSEGNPPPPGSILQNAIPLLLYGENVPGVPEVSVSEDRRMQDFSEADEWSGGVWLEAGRESAVILVGTKALGDTWYGFSNGVVYPTSGDEDEEYPEVPPWPHDNRGWWSQDISARILFFDPSELGAVATGELDPWQPQPYASMSLDKFLFDPGFDYERGKRYLVGAAAFDSANGLLYIIERLADENERSLVHVFSTVP